MNKILIANRGEIAVRIIRACHELGLQTVAIYSEGDKDALHTQIADEAYCVGPTQSKDSYLNIANILSIATSTCLLYTSPIPRDLSTSRLPSSA